MLVCPPELAELGLGTDLLRDVRRHLDCLPPVPRRVIGPTLRLFNQAARLRPAARGRRFTQLDDARADAYLRHVLYERDGPVATVLRLVKGVVVLCYYELPEVRAALGYDPDSYIAGVSARRLARYGAEIRAAEIRAAEIRAAES